MKLTDKSKAEIIEYKYNIHYLLRQLSYADYEIGMKFLPEFIGCSKSTFKEWIYRKSDNPKEIPSGAIRKMATYFEVSIEEMFNSEIHQEYCKEKFNLFKKEHFPEVIDNKKFNLK